MPTKPSVKLRFNAVLSAILVFSMAGFLLSPFSQAKAAPHSVTFDSSEDFETNTTPTQVVTDDNRISLEGIPDPEGFQTIAAGVYHTLAIKDDGTLWSWGYNSSGELGLDDTDDREAPTQVGTDDDWTTVTAGYYFSLALKQDGTLWAWGLNNDECSYGCGQLGLGEEIGSVDVPTQVGEDTDWLLVEAGAYSGFGLKQDGTLWAWGYNGNGELGLDDFEDRFVPTQVGEDTDWSVITAGDGITFALKDDATLWAWGYNGDGELGLGDTESRDVPTQVGTDEDWSKIGSGYAHTLAIKDDGSLWAWGYNSVGELGLGDTDDRDVPTQVGTDEDWASVFSGAYNEHSLAVKEDGTLWSWGYNSEGQLGLGDTDDRDVPTQVGTDEDWVTTTAGSYHSVALKSDGTLWSWGVYPDDDCGDNCGQLGITGSVVNKLQNDADWAQVSAGNYHSLALKDDGTIWGWGYNGSSQLGLGLNEEEENDTDNREVPTQIGTDEDWAAIAGGDSHSLGLKTDGTIWSWGGNGNSELGLGEIVDETVAEPTQIGTDEDWAYIEVGDDSSLAIKTDGTLWMWGSNGFGELGQGDTDNRDVPTQVGTDTDWDVAVLGYDVVFAIKTDGTLWAWGWNDTGLLGLGDTGEHFTPTQVGTDTDWQMVSDASYHGMALKTDGTIWVAGSNASGELGMDEETDTELHTFFQMNEDDDWAYVASNGYDSDSSFAIKSDGTLWAWGYNGEGQLGLGDFDNRFVPEQVGENDEWESLSIGYHHALGIKSDGTLWAWGTDAHDECDYDCGQRGISTKYENQIGEDEDWKISSVYSATGTLTGFVVDAGEKATWTSVEWISNVLPAGTSIGFRARSSDDNVLYSEWSEYFTQDEAGSTEGAADLTGLARSRYLEVGIKLDTEDTSQTPRVLSFTVNYETDSGRRKISGGTYIGSESPKPSDTNYADKAILVLDKGVIYVIESGVKHPFVSMDVFLGLGYSLDQVIGQDTTSIPEGPGIFDVMQRHLKGTLVLDSAGTIWLLGENQRFGIPSEDVFFSWGYQFKDVVKANDYDLAIPVGDVVLIKM